MDNSLMFTGVQVIDDLIVEHYELLHRNKQLWQALLELEEDELSETEEE